jgi:hypothetical protein
LELRAASNLARLWCDQGKRNQPRELLSPIFDTSVEGLDTQDLVDARNLIGELR